MNIQLKGLDKALLMLDEKLVRKAARMTINEGLTTGRKVASKEIRKDWNISATRVNKELRKFKLAKNNDLKAIIRAKGRPISLVQFRAIGRRGKTTTTRFGRRVGKVNVWHSGVSVTIKKSKGKRLLSHAFIATMPNGHIGVMERSGRFGRRGDRNLERIKSMATVTIATMFNNDAVMVPTVRSIYKRMDDRFAHHINRLIK